MTELKTALLTFIALLSAVSAASGQIESAGPVTPAMQIEISRSLGALIEERYVIEAEAQRLSAGIAEAIATGRFDTAVPADEFVNSLNAPLQQTFPDRHLGILMPERYAEMVMMFGSDADDATPAGDAAGHAPEHAVAGHAPAGHERHDTGAQEDRAGRERAGLDALREIAGITRVSEISRDGLNQIGYIAFDRMIGSARAQAAVDRIFETFTDSDHIIIDLRECRGGDADMVWFISNYFFAQPTHLLSTQMRGGAENQHWAEPNALSASFADRRLDVLISGTTFSAGEALAFGLQHAGRARLLGQATGGGGHMNDFFSLPYGFGASISVGRSYDPRTGQGWQAAGVVPDIVFEPGHALSGTLALITAESGRLAAMPEPEVAIYDVLQSYTHAWYIADAAEMDRVIAADFEASFNSGSARQSRDRSEQLLATADGVGVLPPLYHNRIIQNIEIAGDSATAHLILRETSHDLELRRTDQGWIVALDNYRDKGVYD